MDAEHSYPVIRQTVLDTTEPRPLAEFYRLLFGLRYRPGDEPPASGQADPKGDDWLVLRNPAGGPALAFQKVGKIPEATWPDGPVPQQLHLDTSVPSVADLDIQHERALTLGCSRTVPMTRRSRCGSTPTRPGTRSASSSPPDSRAACGRQQTGTARI